MMERRHFVQCGGLLLAVQLVGCGGEDGDDGESSTGGTNQGTGGDTTATGGTNQGTGGDTTATGGTGGSTGGTDQGTGGDPSTGGDTSTGGDGNMDENACMGDLEGASSSDSGHDHVFTLPLAAITAGQPTTLTLEVEASNGNNTLHEHSVELTADDLATLQAGGTVEKTSDGAQHQHTVTLSCVG